MKINLHHEFKIDMRSASVAPGLVFHDIVKAFVHLASVLVILDLVKLNIPKYVLLWSCAPRLSGWEISKRRRQ